jgi:SAM-dependent methyltransferase
MIGRGLRKWIGGVRGLSTRRWLDAESHPASPAPGSVRWGSFRRLTPISRNFGFERGQPIDRYYIERFLADHSPDIHGDVLEIKDSTYTRLYGADRVASVTVLDIDPSNREATMVGDLTKSDDLPRSTFDCIVLTQTLQLLFDLPSAVTNLFQSLKPGGVLLATVPGISRIGSKESDCWCWFFTANSVRRLFEREFPSESLKVLTCGNVLAAVSFLHGLAVQELQPKELDFRDGHFPVLIAIRAEKPAHIPLEGGR